MTVEELPEGTNLTRARVILPDDALEQYQEYLGGEKEMYIVGALMGDFFLSPTRPTSDCKGSRSLCPMPQFIDPPDILKWEVAQVLEDEDLVEGVTDEKEA